MVKDYETERARQEGDSVAAAAVVMLGGLGLVLLWVGYALPFAGRVVLVVVLGTVLVGVTLRRLGRDDVPELGDLG